MTPRVGLGIALLVACHPLPLAAQSPAAGRPMALSVESPDQRPVRAQGMTPPLYLPNARHALVLVIPDRGDSSKKVLRELPLDVLGRERTVVVALDVSSRDLSAAGFTRLRSAVEATADAARTTWSIDPERIFLLGIGRGAAPALWIARSTTSPIAAVAGVRPEGEWIPEEKAAAAELPALLVAPTESALEPLDAAIAGSLALRLRAYRGLEEDAELALFQPVLEWFLSQNQPVAEKAIDRVKGRTAAGQQSAERVICIEGEFDEVESVLDTLEIPHTVLTWKDFVSFDLAPSDVVFINCASNTAYGSVRAEASKRLRAFAERGGYVFSTDWALRWPIADVFSDHVRWVDPSVEQAMVDVAPAAGMANHRLLRNVFPIDRPEPRWQLDAQSWLLEPRRPDVELLMASEEMGALYDGNRAVGAMFRVGAYGGVVLNVVSHFSHQGDGAEETPMYQLIVNFINAAREDRERRRK